MGFDTEETRQIQEWLKKRGSMVASIVIGVIVVAVLVNSLGLA